MQDRTGRRAEGIAIVITMDISSSMLAEDFSPENRLQVARTTVKQFVQGREYDRIGLVAFGQLVELDEAPTIVAEMDGEIGGALAYRLIDASLHIVAISPHGDTLDFKNGTVLVNGEQLTEPYIDNAQTTPPIKEVDPEQDGSITVPSGELFVMGDNRTSSFDSRYFGPIKESSIVGRVFVRIWPLNDLGFL